MESLLIKNTAVLVTMDDERREIVNGGLFVRGNVIEQVRSEEHTSELQSRIGRASCRERV